MNNTKEISKFVSKNNLKVIWEKICNVFLTKSDASSIYATKEWVEEYVKKNLNK